MRFQRFDTGTEFTIIASKKFLVFRWVIHNRVVWLENVKNLSSTGCKYLQSILGCPLFAA